MHVLSYRGDWPGVRINCQAKPTHTHKGIAGTRVARPSKTAYAPPPPLRAKGSKQFLCPDTRLRSHDTAVRSQCWCKMQRVNGSPVYRPTLAPTATALLPQRRCLGTVTNRKQINTVQPCWSADQHGGCGRSKNASHPPLQAHQCGYI